MAPARWAFTLIGLLACGDEGGAGGAGGESPASGSSSSSSSSEGSSSSVDYAQCADLACGARCLECQGFGCWDAFCHDDGLCSHLAPECAKKTLCYVLAPEETACAGTEAAGARLCASCAAEGCTFFGQYLGAAVMESGECCYEVAGGCEPPP